MHTEPFINFLARITDLSPNLIDELKDNVNKERYTAHQVLVSEGQTENRVWYLTIGLARSYIYDDQEQQHTLRFWHPDEVIFSYGGFLKEPSKEYIELLTAGELYSCTYEKLEQMMRQYPEAAKVVGEINRRFQQKDHKRSQLLAMKGKDRYLLLRKEHPEIFAQVPQWIIASYLHMTRENLSRIISEES